jgi:hypothetical protein
VPPNVKPGQVFHVRVQYKPSDENSKEKSKPQCLEKTIMESMNSGMTSNYGVNEMKKLAYHFASICSHCGSDQTRVWKSLPSQCRAFRLCESCGNHILNHKGLFRKVEVEYA